MHVPLFFSQFAKYFVSTGLQRRQVDCSRALGREGPLRAEQ